MSHLDKYHYIDKMELGKYDLNNNHFINDKNVGKDSLT